MRLALLSAIGLAACAAPRTDPPPRPAAEPLTVIQEAVHSAPETVSLVLDGHETQVDVARPSGGVPRAAVVLAHGFLRSRATMSGHAAMFAQAGLLAVAPDLPYLVDSRDNARALNDLVAMLRDGRFGAPVSRVVLVGFSAGGLAALLAAGSEGVVGYVGLDPYDRPGGTGRSFASSLQVPAALLRAPPSACNAYSIAAPWAQALPWLEVDHVFDAARHCDFESPSDLVCRVVCGAPDPQRQQAIRLAMREIVLRWALGG